MNAIPWPTRYNKSEIHALLQEQFDSFWQRDTGIQRQKLADVQKAARSPHAVIISGLRRVGKSTLLAQVAHQLGKEAFYYLNFEDERFLGFQAQDANMLFQSLVEKFGDRKIFFCDEIQNIPEWEYFVRRFMEMGYKFYITGSNASLLSRELGTRLTGRYISIELFPFSFTEFLQFRQRSIPEPQQMTTIERGILNQELNDYLQLGGVPDALKYPELNLLRTLYNDVLYRDIAVRYRQDSLTALRELAYFLYSNPATPISYNKIKDRLQLGSVNTVSSYIEYMQNSWLIFTLNKYAYSVKKQQLAPKKVYCIDTGLVNTVGFHFSPNTGKFLENIVFLALRRKYQEIFYYMTRDDYEVDFYIPEKKQLIQVTQQMHNTSTRERELRAMEAAIQESGAQSALILTDRNEDDLILADLPVKVQSIAEWLIE